MKELRGNYPAIITPFKENYEVDYKGFRYNIDRLIKGGVGGIIVAGSGGEAAYLTLDEYKKLLDVSVDQVNGRVPVVASPISSRTEGVIEKIKIAEDAGADALMVLPPYYYTIGEEELFQFYSEITNVSNLQIMLYNNPGPTNLDMTPELMVKLASISPLIRYIKDTTSDVRKVHRILQLSDHKLRVFAGYDNMGLTPLVLGATGWVNTTTNVVPKELSQIAELAIDKKDFIAARKLYYRMLPLLHFLGGARNKWLPWVKACVTLMGGVGGIPRKPLIPASDSDIEKLKLVLKSVGLKPKQ